MTVGELRKYLERHDDSEEIKIKVWDTKNNVWYFDIDGIQKNKYESVLRTGKGKRVSEDPFDYENLWAWENGYV